MSGAGGGLGRGGDEVGQSGAGGGAGDGAGVGLGVGLGGDRVGPILTTKAASTSAKAFFSLSGPTTRLPFFKGIRSLHRAMAFLMSQHHVTASIFSPPRVPLLQVTTPCR